MGKLPAQREDLVRGERNQRTTRMGAGLGSTGPEKAVAGAESFVSRAGFTVN